MFNPCELKALLDPTPLGERKDQQSLLPLLTDLMGPLGPSPQLWTATLELLPLEAFQVARLDSGTKQDGVSFTRPPLLLVQHINGIDSMVVVRRSVFARQRRNDGYEFHVMTLAGSAIDSLGAASLTNGSHVAEENSTFADRCSGNSFPSASLSYRR